MVQIFDKGERLKQLKLMKLRMRGILVYLILFFLSNKLRKMK